MALARRRRGVHRRRHGGRRHGADAAALGDPLARRHAHGRAAALGAGARTRCAMSASRSRRSSPKRCRRRRTPPSASRSTTSRCPPSSTRAPRRRRARRSCTRRRPAMSASAWRAATKPRCARRSQSAAHVVAIDLVNNRLIGAAIEPRAAIATVDPVADKLTLYSSTQVPHHIRRAGHRAARHAGERAARDLARCRRRLRLQGQALSRGERSSPGRRAGCGGRCAGSATRTESFVSDNQARDHLTHAELALDADGHFLALRVETVANLGAYVSTFGAAIPSAIYSALLAGVYRTPAIFVECTGVFTNTAPTDAYRGAGRPEACYVLERLADAAAQKLGLDRAEIRRRNLIPPRPCRTRRRSGRPTTAATFRRSSRARSRSPTTTASRSAAREAARARAAARHRHRLLRRILGRRAVALRRGARRARRLLRGGVDPRRARRRGARRARHPQSRPGPRHHLRADPVVAARRADRADRDHRGRHRRGAVRHRHVRLALDRGRRLARSIAPATRSSPRAS